MLCARRVKNYCCNKKNNQKCVRIDNRQGNGIFLHFLHLHRILGYSQASFYPCALVLSIILNKIMV